MENQSDTLQHEQDHDEGSDSRYGYLKSVAGGLSILGGGAAYLGFDQGILQTGTGPAYEPWDNWQKFDEKGPLNIVRAAILAPSPHNSQPWHFDVTESSVELFADQTRTLGSFDSLNREFHIGLGCALENGVLAARANGFSPEISLFPDKTDIRYVATIDLSQAIPEVSPLYEAIPERHTNRGPYDTSRSVATDTMKKMQAFTDDFSDVALTWVTEDESMDRLSEMIVEATASIIRDDEMVDDSSEWFRHDWDEIQTKRDGVTIDAQGLSTVKRILGKMLPAPSNDRANSIWLDATENKHTKTAAAYGLLTVSDVDNRSQLVQAGRLWQRLHLFGTTQSLAMHPLNQVTEWIDRQITFGETSAHKKELGEFTAENNRPVFTFRIGYPVQTGRKSPRRSLDMVRKSNKNIHG